MVNMEGMDSDDTQATRRNPWIAGFEARQEILKATRGYALAEQVRLLNFASYAFGKNTQDLQDHINRYPAMLRSGSVRRPIPMSVIRLRLSCLVCCSTHSRRRLRS